MPESRTPYHYAGMDRLQPAMQDLDGLNVLQREMLLRYAADWNCMIERGIMSRADIQTVLDRLARMLQERGEVHETPEAYEIIAKWRRELGAQQEQ